MMKSKIIAKVTPLFKSADADKVSIYRPIYFQKFLRGSCTIEFIST